MGTSVSTYPERAAENKKVARQDSDSSPRQNWSPALSELRSLDGVPEQITARDYEP